MEDPGGAEEFEHGGWTLRFDRGDEGNQFKVEEVKAAEAQLLGRVTYESFAAAWPTRDDPVEFAARMNTMPKYVVSTTLRDEDATWNNSTVIRGDVAHQVAALRQHALGDLLVAGSATLVQTLLEHGLVDELRLMVFPIVLGSGRRLFGAIPGPHTLPGRTLYELMPDEPEPVGLLALMLLISARQPARSDDQGALIPLGEQDRTRWDRARIAEGQALVRFCLRRNAPGPYQVQAAINAVHSDARHSVDTDWRQVFALYDQLLVLDPSPVVALNRAVAVAECEGPAAGLTVVDGLPLETYYLFHAVRADLLSRAGRVPEALVAYDAALERTDNDAERTFLTQAQERARAKAMDRPGQ